VLRSRRQASTGSSAARYVECPEQASGAECPRISSQLSSAAPHEPALPSHHCRAGCATQARLAAAEAVLARGASARPNYAAARRGCASRALDTAASPSATEGAARQRRRVAQPRRGATTVQRLSPACARRERRVVDGDRARLAAGAACETPGGTEHRRSEPPCSESHRRLIRYRACSARTNAASLATRGAGRARRGARQAAAFPAH